MAETTAAAIEKDVERGAATEDPRPADLFVVGAVLVAALAAFALYFWRLAAGDAAGAPYQVAKAVGDGCAAALSACKFIENKSKEE